MGRSFVGSRQPRAPPRDARDPPASRPPLSLHSRPQPLYTRNKLSVSLHAIGATHQFSGAFGSVDDYDGAILVTKEGGD